MGFPQKIRLQLLMEPLCSTIIEFIRLLRFSCLIDKALPERYISLLTRLGERFAEMSKVKWTTLIPDLDNTSVGKRQIVDYFFRPFP